MTPAKTKNLKRLLSPKHIAFVGGTDVSMAISEATRIGYRGQIWAVNTKRRKINGYECYKSVKELPSPPDATFLAVPATAAIQICSQLKEIGAGGVVCYSAGFKETGGNGADLEKDLINASGEMALVGPNCYGVINFLSRTALWPFAHGNFCPGFGAAIITQSGMFSSDITMTERSIPITHMVSTGNQADLGLEDFVGFFCENPRVKAIGIHIEGIKDINKFQYSALKALKHNTPIVALKTGVSRLGRALTVSHTGSLAGEDTLYDAFFSRVGIIRVKTPDEFLETLKFLCTTKLPAAGTIIGFTCSGGGATMLADYSEKEKLIFPEFKVSEKDELKTMLPSIATVSNPMDYTTPIWGVSEKTKPLFKKAIEFSSASTAILVQDYPAAGLNKSRINYSRDTDAFIEATSMNNVSAIVCSTFPENLDKKVRRRCISGKVAPIQGITNALAVIKAAVYYTTAKNRIEASPPAELLKPSISQRTALLDEIESKNILKLAGIPVPLSFLVSSQDLNSGKIPTLSYPVVLKIVSHKLPHKTEYGAVSTDINSSKNLEAAAHRMQVSIKKYRADIKIEKFLIEKMAIKPRLELLVGLKTDPQFGAILVLASGGIFTELLKDHISIVLPTTEKELCRSLKSLKSYPILAGYRQAAGTNISLIAKEILKLANYFLNSLHKYASIEINPMFIYEESILAVDALVERKDD